MKNDNPHNKRKRYARIFALGALAFFLFWGASLWRKAYPQEVEIRYSYKNMLDSQDIKRTQSIIRTKERVISRVTFFHPKAMLSEGKRNFRSQHLRLDKGSYDLRVRLYYSKNKYKKLSQTLVIHKDETYYVYLKKAK